MREVAYEHPLPGLVEQGGHVETFTRLIPSTWDEAYFWSPPGHSLTIYNDAPVWGVDMPFLYLQDWEQGLVQRIEQRRRCFLALFDRVASSVSLPLVVDPGAPFNSEVHLQQGIFPSRSHPAWL